MMSEKLRTFVMGFSTQQIQMKDRRAREIVGGGRRTPKQIFRYQKSNFDCILLFIFTFGLHSRRCLTNSRESLSTPFHLFRRALNEGIQQQQSMCMSVNDPLCFSCGFRLNALCKLKFVTHTLRRLVALFCVACCQLSLKLFLHNSHYISTIFSFSRQDKEAGGECK